jgi:hypothetical protein
MNQTILVPWQRLADGVFDKKNGDIQSAYSADKKPKVRTFTHDGKLFTCMGIHWKPCMPEAWCHQLMPFTEPDPPKVPYSNEGEAVTFNGGKYRLGPAILFVASDRTVEEWRIHYRAIYTDGGYFTSEKTYHQFIEAQMERDQFKQGCVAGYTITGNVKTAMSLELAAPDFTKWAESRPDTKQSEPQQGQLPLVAPTPNVQLPSAIPAWRAAFKFNHNQS